MRDRSRPALVGTKLSPAQRDALEVLVKVAEKPGGGRVGASKRRSTLTPRPNVNMIAADSLRQLGLARFVLKPFNGFSCADEYEATAAGVALWAERCG